MALYSRPVSYLTLLKENLRDKERNTISSITWKQINVVSDTNYSLTHYLSHFKRLQKWFVGSLPSK
jgi:hypothetical protein